MGKDDKNMAYKYVDFKNDNGTAWVYINRPEQRNALCKELLIELVDVFKKIDKDDAIRVAVLTGTGKVFIGGADIKEMVDMTSFEYMEYGNLMYSLVNAIRENSKPVIGAANGHAFGGGNVVILASDMIVASENAKFSQPEIHLGIFGGSVLMAKLVGRYRAAEIAFLGERYSAQRAYEMGLVNKVVPDQSLEDEVKAIAEKIKAKSPLAIKFAKKAVLAGMLYDLNSAGDYQHSLLSMLYSGHDQKEGMRSFIEKTTPEFTGK